MMTFLDASFLRKCVVGSFLVGAPILFSPQALAADLSRWYSGLEYQVVEIEQGPDFEFANLGGDVSYLGLLGGYKLLPNLNFEGALFFGLSDATFGVAQISFPNGDQVDYREMVEVKNGFSIAIKGFYPVTANMSVYAALKYRYLDLEFQETFSDRRTEANLQNGTILRSGVSDETSSRMRLGVGIDFAQSSEYPINFTVGYFFEDGVTAGLNLHF